MIWRNTDDDRPVIYCDIGPHAGKWRAHGYLYGTKEELDALFDSRDNELAVVVPDKPEAGPGDGGWISGAMSNPEVPSGKDQRLRSA